MAERTMPAGEFKARCLRVMEEVRKYRTPVVITKKGRQVARLVPIDAPAADVFGCMASTARIVGDVEKPVLEAGLWEAVTGAGARRAGASRARAPRDAASRSGRPAKADRGRATRPDASRAKP
jgi:prevent-host-death family protein